MSLVLKQTSLRPHDVAVALQIIITPHDSFAALANGLNLSASEVHGSVQRLRLAKLLGSSLARRVHKTPLEMFILHGVRYAFPAELGTPGQGVPTAHSGPALREHFAASAKHAPEDAYVWASAHGTVRGVAISPLYAGAAATAVSSPRPLHLAHTG